MRTLDAFLAFAFQFHGVRRFTLLLPPFFPNFGGLSKMITVGDFNSDRRPDIVIVDSGVSVVLFNHAPTPAPDFLVVAAAPKPATLARGDSASSKVTITPVGTFGSSVALSCTGLPSGATCSFTPATITNGSGASTLTIATSASTPVATYAIQIVATAAPNVHTRVLTLIVANANGVTTATLSPQTLVRCASDRHRKLAPGSDTDQLRYRRDDAFGNLRKRDKRRRLFAGQQLRNSSRSGSKLPDQCHLHSHWLGCSQRVAHFQRQRQR